MVISFVKDLVKSESWFKYFIGLNIIILACSILGPILVGQIIKTMTEGDFILSSFIFSLSIYIASCLIKLVVSYFTFKYTNQMFGRMSLKATKDLYSIALDKNIDFILENSSGNISHKINNTFNTIQSYIGNLFNVMLRSSMLFLGYISIMFYYSPQLAGFIFVTVIVYAKIILNLRKNLKAKQKEYNISKDTLFTYITDTVSNILLLKSFSNKNIITKEYQKLSDDNLSKNYSLWNFSANLSTLEFSAWPLFSIITIIFGSIGMANGSLTIAEFFVLWTVVNPLAFNYTRIISAYNNYTRHTGTLENTLELLNRENLEDYSKKELKYSNGDIEFKNINFKYTNNYVLKNFNLTIKNGEKLALVGRSGAGKSTIVSILQGFYMIDDGDILINNQSVKDIRLSSLREVISYIPQEPSLLSQSIYDNISIAKPDATIEEVKNAAKLANADEFIKKLPNGYDELVGERGFKLSGGQKQRIAIARAILKDSPIIVMDEATSALDSQSEKLIQESLNHLLKNKTCIVIAHRLSTIKSMDRVIVLDEGQIIQDGAHNSLVRKIGLYKELWNLQQEGFIE